jgi:hypothetical protein
MQRRRRRRRIGREQVDGDIKEKESTAKPKLKMLTR